MSLNAGARIVPLTVANAILRRVAGPWAPGAKFPDNYARVQLLTEEAYRELLFVGFDDSGLIYGDNSGDFPLCADFASIAREGVKLEAIKRGLAVRPYYADLYYTRTKPPRHAISIALTADERALYAEPQGKKWLPLPKDLLTLDEVKL